MIKLDEKLNKLAKIIHSYNRMVVALSGGVDSAFLLIFACNVFSETAREKPVYEYVSALTATGPQFIADETEYAEKLCDKLGISHKKIDVSHVIDMIKTNPPDRCYHCKKEIFGSLKEYADMVNAVLVDGTNLDDMDDYRPGYKAIQELGVVSPLKEAGLTKEEIREALGRTEREWKEEYSNKNAEIFGGIATKPAAACLVSRVPYGEIITEQKLKATYEAELFLREKGFKQVRVRCHEIAGKVSGKERRLMARIELEPEEMARFCSKSPNDNRQSDVKSNNFADEFSTMRETEQKLKSLGFEYVTMDLGGYSKGKMNSILI